GYEAFFQLHVYLKIIVQATLLLLTPLGLLIAAAGVIVVSRKNPGCYLFHWWAVGLLIYLIIGLNGNYRHEYYQLPFVPVAAAFAGVFGDYIVTRLEETHSASPGFYKTITFALVFAVILVSSFALLTIKYHSQPEELLYQAGKSVEANIPRNAL